MSDESDLRTILQDDARIIVRAASLPSARQALWRAQAHRVRIRHGRIARLVNALVAAALGVPAIVLTAIAWQSIVATPPADHAITIGVMTVTTMLLVAILAAIPLAGRGD
jgi:hypothetical protein